MGTMDCRRTRARNRTPWKWPPLRLRQNGLSRSLYLRHRCCTYGSGIPRTSQRRIHFTAASYSGDHFERRLRCGRVRRQTISGDFRVYRYNLRRSIRRFHRIFKSQDDCPVRRISKVGRTDHASYPRSYGKNLLAIYKGKVKLVLSELKESDAAVLGASALGWEAS